MRLESREINCKVRFRKQRTMHKNSIFCRLMRWNMASESRSLFIKYNIFAQVGSIVFVIFGTLDLKYPSREAFHNVLGYKLSWVPNGLYIWAFALVAYVGILGLLYYCFGPKKKKTHLKPEKKYRIRCCKRQSRSAERVLIGFVSVEWWLSSSKRHILSPKKDAK